MRCASADPCELLIPNKFGLPGICRPPAGQFHLSGYRVYRDLLRVLFLAKRKEEKQDS
jgi:hypothetical protein